LERGAVRWEQPIQSRRSLHHGGPQGVKPKVEVVADFLAALRNRRP